jgi:uncharacterized protein (TIGR03435 family)
VAYKLNQFQVVGGPKWMESARFNVVAKYPAGATREQWPERLQTLLADRFKLATHRETRMMTEYALVVGKGGPKLEKASEEDIRRQRFGARAEDDQAMGPTGLAFGRGLDQRGGRAGGG